MCGCFILKGRCSGILQYLFINLRWKRGDSIYTSTKSITDHYIYTGQIEASKMMMFFFFGDRSVCVCVWRVMMTVKCNSLFLLLFLSEERKEKKGVCVAAILLFFFFFWIHQIDSVLGMILFFCGCCSYSKRILNWTMEGEIWEVPFTKVK